MSTKKGRTSIKTISKPSSGSRDHTMLLVRGTRDSNSVGNTYIPRKRAAISAADNTQNNPPRTQFKGQQTRNSTSSPVNEVASTQRVESCSTLNGTYMEIAMTNNTFADMVMAPGTAFISTLVTNRPCTRSLFGSNANRKDGAPMVKALISVNWIGRKG